MLTFVKLFMVFTLVYGEAIINPNHVTGNQVPYGYLPAPQPSPPSHLDSLYKYQGISQAYQFLQPQPIGIQPVLSENSLLTALLLQAVLGVPALKYSAAANRQEEHPPVNPYITLLLSQYGRYLPVHALGTKGLYYYAASNNYHNNKPFGSYKVHESAR